MVFGRDSPPRVNSELVLLADEIVTLDPVADNVAVRALLLPRATLPKFNVVALVISCPPETPVPERTIEREGVTQPFENTVICPVWLPNA
jgi:hypothetical protein